ncbi:VP5 [Gokushovirus WZ-2015a]|nr:VP5 [Gokushovirus WZ-2015a]
MMLGVYSVKDTAVNAFLTPFFARTDAEAVRSFSDACMDTKHQFAMHARDYELYRIGTFHDVNGELDTHLGFLVSALSFQVTASVGPEQ